MTASLTDSQQGNRDLGLTTIGTDSASNLNKAVRGSFPILTSDFENLGKKPNLTVPGLLTYRIIH